MILDGMAHKVLTSNQIKVNQQFSAASSAIQKTETMSVGAKVQVFNP
jgi:hypothetical protein